MEPTKKLPMVIFLFLLKNVSRFCIAKSVTIFNNSNGNRCICDINI